MNYNLIKLPNAQGKMVDVLVPAEFTTVIKKHRDALPKIHTSDMKQFKRCRRKWDIQSRIRQNLQPKRMAEPLWLGIGVHEALDHYYSNFKNGMSVNPAHYFDNWASGKLDDAGELSVDSELAAEELIGLGKGILEHYAMWAPDHDDFEVVWTEINFSVPILEMYEETAQDGSVEIRYKIVALYEGTMDGIVQDELGRYWILEHKTAKTFDNQKLPWDEQCASYLMVAKELFGIDCAGILYNILRKKVPQPPKQLKPNKKKEVHFSQNKAQDTTAMIYYNTLLEAGISKEEIQTDYIEILDHLNEKGNQFFSREQVWISQAEVNEIKTRIWNTVQDMIHVDSNRLYPNPTRDCTWECSAKDVCLAMNRADNYQFLLDEMFEYKTDWRF